LAVPDAVFWSSFFFSLSSVFLPLPLRNEGRDVPGMSEPNASANPFPTAVNGSRMLAPFFSSFLGSSFLSPFASSR